MTGPLILTSGEPAGVGPEITAAAWAALRQEPACAFALLGDATYWRSRNPGLAIAEIATPGEAGAAFAAALPVLHRPLAVHPTPGLIAHGTAPQVIAAIDEAVDMAFSGAAGGIVTNPIQKEALYGAGFRHQGHTDYLAHLSARHGQPVQEVMMLVADGLRAIPVTVHIPLKDVPAQLTREAILGQARVTAHGLARYFGIAKPRLAFTGLNPHAGENGAMGREEIEVIRPAIDTLRAEGFHVLGPLSADTAFHAEARAAYDAVLCMYHDQALIPVKTLDFHGGINVSLGLPFIRTSPDHGTALGIAGTHTANPKSLIAAIRLAAQMRKAAA
ncbi:MAG: 4-hydroxythreonine-4-phosphate dehydrogenase PdxA [Aestuariivirga sp.]|uniref:4-hydroxythreonine-4-phosphate dehydrogenase PdxA n=1 Tax=Aestuariivirga sp. TaxID=2650926 RepID=UPI0025B9523D|nr:4-hydroxythreonine-4-phosphate dehydrogenase PdxA [Aestuariivirga sp.]MCA3561635.1 4-hydroxythreonine-4-phosphate dehydrogenase PdxA [Aestuariivirga sp.]